MVSMLLDAICPSMTLDGVYIFTTPFMVVILKEKQVVVTGGEEC